MSETKSEYGLLVMQRNIRVGRSAAIVTLNEILAITDDGNVVDYSEKVKQEGLKPRDLTPRPLPFDSDRQQKPLLSILSGLIFAGEPLPDFPGIAVMLSGRSLSDPRYNRSWNVDDRALPSSQLAVGEAHIFTHLNVQRPVGPYVATSREELLYIWDTDVSTGAGFAPTETVMALTDTNLVMRTRPAGL